MNRTEKIIISILSILIISLSAAIILVSSQPQNTQPIKPDEQHQSGKTDDELEPEPIDDEEEFVQSIKDISRITNFLTIYSKQSVDLSTDPQARIQFVEWAVSFSDENAELEEVRFVKQSTFKQDYLNTFGDFYNFEEDIADLPSNIFHDCSESFDEPHYCYDDITINPNLFFELFEPKITGEDNDYEAIGEYIAFINLEENPGQYKITYKNNRLFNLVLPY